MAYCLFMLCCILPGLYLERKQDQEGEVYDLL